SVFSASPRSDARCSRNSRSSGLRPRVSSAEPLRGERDLNEVVGMRSPRLSLGQELSVDRAGLVLIEAELKRVPQALELERLGAARVGAIQKRAVRNGVCGHVPISPGRTAEHNARRPILPGNIGASVKAPAILWSPPRPRLGPAVSGSANRGRPGRNGARR